MNITKQKSVSRSNEAGVGIWSAIVLLALIAFIAAVFMKALSIWAAIIGFILIVFAALLLASLPDIVRYNKISNM